MKERWSKLSSTVTKLANAGAWLFAGGTMLVLASAIWTRWPGAGGSFHVMRTNIDGIDYSAIGLHYTGLGGTFLTWTQMLVLLAAIMMSLLRRNRLRRIGHVVLVLWSSLWLANAICLGQFDGSFVLMWSAVVVVTGVFFGCTILRAARGWSGPKLKPKPPSIDPPQGKLALSAT